MIVILLQDLKGTGKAGEVVKVSDGYARNMLIPKGIAKQATSGNVKSLEKQKKIMAEQEAGRKSKAEDLVKRIEDLTLEIKSKGGEGGRLFGSVTSMDIAAALEEQEDIHVDRKKIVLDSPIKQTGPAEVVIKVYPEVSATLKINVIV